MTTDILSRIADYKRVDVAARKSQMTTSSLEKQAELRSPPRGFRSKLVAAHAARPDRLALIAEIKKASPSKGLIRESFNPAGLAKAYERGGAACLSVLTDTPSFQGTDDDFRAAREAVALPCIRKDFLVDPWQVLESRTLGADAILVILAMIDDRLARTLIDEAARLGMDALVEVHDTEEMSRAADLGAQLVGVNNRDLRTFTVDLAVTERLAQRAPPGAVLVTESGVFTSEDVARLAQSGAAAMLVGESLMRQDDVALAARALLA